MAAEGHRRQLFKLVKWLVRVSVLLVVAWGVWRTVGKAMDDLQVQRSALEQQLAELDHELGELSADERTADDAAAAERRRELLERRRQLRSQRFSLWQIQPGWLLLAGGMYLLGMVPSWLFWYRTLHAMGQRPRLFETLRAFCIGHLGKYVPGKAMVVVLRAGLMRSDRVNATVAATSVFVETLTLMAVGALVAAALLGLLYRHHWQLLLLALGLSLLAGLPTAPPLFRRLVRLLQVRRANPDIESALAGLDWKLMGFGWGIVSVGWLAYGLSLWAVLRALPSAEMQLSGIGHDLPLLTACVALAMVAGFLSLIPGGFGVREGVVMALLAQPYGAYVAVVSAVLLRLVWLVAELAISIILYVFPGPRASHAIHRDPGL